MKIIIILCAQLYIWFISSMAIAGEPSHGCKQINLYEYAECVGGKREAVDEQMNENYKYLYKQLKQEDKLKLKKAQRLWIQFRDSNCGFQRDISEVEAPSNNSQMLQGALAYSECMFLMTANRSDELAKTYPSY